MKRAPFLATLALLAACGGEETKPVEREKPTPPVAPSAPAPETKPAPEPPPPATTVDAGTQPAPAVDARQAKLEAEWNRYADTVVSHSASELPDGEKEMLRHLLDAASLVEELAMLQTNPENLAWRDRVFASGTEIEKRIFIRYQSPWCADDTSADCCALADCPKRETGLALWPEGFTDAEHGALGAQINGRELLSPFTIVRRADGGKLRAVPFAESELLGPKMHAVAEALRAAAKTAPSKSLAKFLRARADAFESKSPFPYDASDLDWIAVDGPWEVTVGPYETYRDPRQHKAMFEMVVARENPEAAADLSRFGAGLQAMEDALGALVGSDIYKGRKLDPRIRVRAVDAWMVAGEARQDRGARVAFHLPNRGQAVDEGLSKKVLLVNHALAFAPIDEAAAALVLDESQTRFVDGAADLGNVLYHELAHGFGAYGEMKVKNAAGATTTVKDALKGYDSLMEELKADVLGKWLVAAEKREQPLCDDERKKRYTSGVMHALGLVQYPLDGTYAQMAAIELGWYLDRGALAWDAGTGRFRIDFDAMPAATEELAKKVATIQLTGDFAGARALFEAYVEKKSDTDFDPKGPLAEARRGVMEKIQTAGITSLSLRYAVTGL